MGQHVGSKQWYPGSSSHFVNSSSKNKAAVYLMQQSPARSSSSSSSSSSSANAAGRQIPNERLVPPPDASMLSIAGPPELDLSQVGLGLRRALLVTRILYVGVGILALVINIQTLYWTARRWSNDGRAIGFTVFIAAILAGVIANAVCVLLWIAYDARPAWRHASTPSRCCCKCPPYVCEALSDFLWAGIWLALLMTMIVTHDREPRYRAAAIMGGVLSLVSGCLVVRLRGVVVTAQAAHAAVYAQVMDEGPAKPAARARRLPPPRNPRPHRTNRQQAALPARGEGAASPRGSLEVARPGRGVPVEAVRESVSRQAAYMEPSTQTMV